MVKIYLRKIRSGDMSIDEVPERWRADVQAELDNENDSNE